MPPKCCYRISLCLVALITVFLGTPTTGFGQTEKLGSVEYAPPKDWKKSENQNIVAFSDSK